MSVRELGPDATVGVVGAGLMGFGIALLFARAGRRVCAYDASAAAREGLQARIRGELDLLGWDQSAADRVEVADELAGAVAPADLVIEAVSENRALKRKVFAAIDAAAAPDTILASNTSVIPISAFTAEVSNRERVLGTHFWNPPHLVPLVEVIATEHTAPQAVDATMDCMRAAGKLAVRVAKDVPGFVGNRMQAALVREAIALVQDGVCDAETVDLVAKNSFGLRLPICGPLENIDLIGADLVCAVHDEILPHLNSEPAALPYLRNLVAEGKTGAKSSGGEGFYSRSHEEHRKLSALLAAYLRRVVA